MIPKIRLWIFQIWQHNSKHETEESWLYKRTESHTTKQSFRSSLNLNRNEGAIHIQGRSTATSSVLTAQLDSECRHNLMTVIIWRSMLNTVRHCQERENDGPRKLFPSWIVLCCVLWQLQCALYQLQSSSSFITTWEEEHNTLHTSIHKHMTHATHKLGRYGRNHWSKLLP